MTAATARTAISSVLGVVTESANAIGSLATAASGGVSMLNTWVNDAKVKQNDRSIIEMHSYRQRLIEETATENVKRQQKILEMCRDETFKELFVTEQENLQKLFDKPKANPAD